MHHAPRRVLICDDEVSIRAVVERRLANAGFDVAAAANAADALTLVMSFRPDIVITDQRMPRMTGVELCHRIIDACGSAAPPVVLLTAQGHTITESDVEGTTVRRVVGKPFSPQRLIKLVEELTGAPANEKRDVDDGGSKAAA